MTFISSQHTHRLAGTALLALALTACGGGSSTNPPAPAPTAATTLALSVSAPQVQAGGQPLALNAVLDAPGTVTWQLAPDSPGSLSAASGATVSYQPPARVSAVTDVTVTATSGKLSKTIVLQLVPDPSQPGLTLLAGTIGGHFILDGKGSAARFDLVADMASDANGNVYVADSRPGAASAVRMIGKDGTVSTLTSTTAGHVDGDRDHARVERVRSLALGAGGQLYLLDAGAQASYLRTLDADGRIATVTTLAAPFADASRIFSDGAGTLYIEASATGKLGKLAGNGSVLEVTGLPPAGQFAADRNGTLYYFSGASGGVGAIFRRTADGVTSTVIAASLQGPRPDGETGATTVSRAVSLTLDADGNLLLIDPDDTIGGTGYRIRKISGGTISTVFADNPYGNYLFDRNNNPGRLRVAGDGSLLLSTDSMVYRLAGGKLVALAGLSDDTEGYARDGQGAAARYFSPGMLGADADGNVYSIEGVNYPNAPFFLHDRLTVRKTSAAGAVTTFAAPDLHGKPSGLAVSRAGVVYVALQTSSSVPAPGQAPGGALYRVDGGSALSLLAGAPGVIDGAGKPRDGNGASATFNAPVLQGIDSDGNLYVADRDYAANAPIVRKVTQQGVVSTVSALPKGLNAAPDGNVYRADPATGVIYRTTPAGDTAAVAGSAGLQGTVLGALPARLDHPSSVVPVGSDTLVVAAGGALLRLVLAH